MNMQSFLTALGVSPELFARIAVAAPLVLLLGLLVTYILSTMHNRGSANRQKAVRNILTSTTRRNTGMSQEEILSRLRPETENTEGMSGTFLKVSEALLKLVNFNKEKTKANLIRSGQRDPKALSRYIVNRGAGMIAGPFLMWFLLGAMGIEGSLQSVGSLIGILAGGIIVDVLLDKAVATRRAQIHTQLPVLLDLLTIYITAGSSFDVSLSRASQALKTSFPVAAAEIMFLRRELEMSIDRERTLRDFADRMGTQAAKTFVAIVVQSEKKGNAVAPALRMLAKDARREVMADIEKKAQKIPTMMQLPMFMFILPAIFASVIGPAIVQVYVVTGQ